MSQVNLNGQSINLIELLSNEMIYEIFSYLDGCDVYHAFSNLNNRFESLLNNSSLFLKIQYLYKTNFVIKNRYEQFIHQNKRKIISLHFSDQFFLDQFINLCAINTSFTCLQSIIFNEISTFDFMILVFYFKSLPCLSSMTVGLAGINDNLGHIYRLVFHLPSLKYFKLRILDNQALNLKMPIAVKEEFCYLKYLVICHPVFIDELISLLSYTPNLSHLYCYNIIETDNNIKLEELIKLTHLTITTNYFTFNKLEEFLKVFRRLKTLTISINFSKNDYLNGYRWQELINNYIPNLEKFTFCYADHINDDFQVTAYHKLIDGFTSSFWTKRQWRFRIIIDNDQVIYLIHPSSDSYSYYDFQEFGSNSSSNYADPNVPIDIKKSQHTSGNNIFINKINSLLELVYVNRLIIDCRLMSASTFIQILMLFPCLDMIRITSLLSEAELFMLNENKEMFDSFVQHNKITKLCLLNMYNDTLELIVRYIVTNIHQNNIRHLTTCCFLTVDATNNKAKELQEMIDSDNLLEHYILHRQREKFYLKWK